MARRATSQPRPLTSLTELTAIMSDLQLMGWQLHIAPAGSHTWQTLAQADLAAQNTTHTLVQTLVTLDPKQWFNGSYQSRT